jgi:putative ABC transport system permease protein
MERRLVGATLSRRPGLVGLAVLAVALGAAVTSALLLVSGDIGDQLSRELRSLGPNVVLAPPLGERAGYLDERDVRARLAAVNVQGAPLLYVTAEVEGRRVELVGADLPIARALHPSWSIGAGADGAIGYAGHELLKKLAVAPGAPLRVRFGGRTVTWRAGAPLTAGGANDAAWWVPLADLQQLAGLEERVSVAEVRVGGGPRDAERVAARLAQDGRVRAEVLHALAATEAGLLARTRRLMTLVTAAALIAAFLCAFGTLTDLALERRREIALMKSLGATRRHFMRMLVAESLVIGTVGGLAGIALGQTLARLIGRRVFDAAITPRWEVAPLVLAISIAVATLSALGPLRRVLAIEPAAVLKGD